jgi:hypothetical protein
VAAKTDATDWLRSDRLEDHSFEGVVLKGIDHSGGVLSGGLGLIKREVAGPFLPGFLFNFIGQR